MCGVGGVFFKTTEHHRKTGEIAYHVLDGIYRRGPDSTGLAFVQPAGEDRLYVGINCEEPGGGGRALALLDELGRVESATDGEGFIRTAIRYDGDDAALVDAIDGLGPAYSVASIGRRLEVLKHLGGVENLEDKFTITDYDGPMAMGLTRYATESQIDFTHGQPLSARLHRDLAIMHNGHITNFHHLRYHFERAGYTFTTGNDSEVIAVTLVDEMGKGASFARRWSVPSRSSTAASPTSPRPRTRWASSRTPTRRSRWWWARRTGWWRSRPTAGRCATAWARISRSGSREPARW